MKIVKPRYKGDRSLSGNYGPAYFGFSYRDNSIFSSGIAIFTKEEYQGIIPSHAFIVRDKNTLIEATIHGVSIKDLNEYFNDPHIITFFKKPIDLTPEDVNNLLFVATMYLGKKYDPGLYGYFLVRKFLRLLGRFEPNRDKPSWFDTSERLICSELCAYILKTIPKYANLFPLSEYHPSKIDPVMLFFSKIFSEWEFDA